MSRFVALERRLSIERLIQSRAEVENVGANVNGLCFANHLRPNSAIASLDLLSDRGAGPLSVIDSVHGFDSLDDPVVSVSVVNPFASVATNWQNFYLLLGTAAATLIGLMFVAVTFGSSRIDRVERPEIMRAFLDPTLSHFVQVLVTACLFLIPPMTSTIIGGLLMAVAAFRVAALVRVHARMKEAHWANGDLEISDWISGIVLPIAEHIGLGASGVLFAVGRPPFVMLAVVTMLVLLNGVYGAWELTVWIAVTRPPQK
jgi:hypothetical protein